MNRVELWINDTLVDLLEESIESLFLINKQIQDIREPEKRQTDFTKTISLPGSKNNDLLFSYAFSLSHTIQSSGVNFTPDFNPNLQTSAVLIIDGAEVFKGIAQLINIHVTDDYLVMYDVQLFGKIANIFTNIGDKELTELDFSEYDHTYNPTNVINSWATSIIKNGASQAFQLGQGYIYPLIDYGYSANLQSFPLINLYPALPVREYLFKIFEDAGFTWQSDFLETPFFKSLYIPFKSATMKLNASQVLARKFRASRETSAQTLSVPIGQANAVATSIVFNDDTTAPNFDSSNQYATGTGIFTVGSGLNGVFTFCSQLRLTATFTPATAGVQVRSQFDVKVIADVLKQDIGGNNTFIHSVAMDITAFNPFTTSYTTDNPGSITPLDPDYTTSPYNPRNYMNIVVPNVSLNEGEKIVIRLRPYAYPNQYGNNNQVTSTQLFQNTSTGVFYDGTITIQVNTGSVFYNLIDNAQIVENQTVLMNNCIPEKIKQKDFFLSLIRMFNLYIEQGDYPNQLVVEPRDLYYTTEVYDLSKKIDKSQEILITPMGALETQRYRFKYRTDTDYYNQIYNDGHPLNYGEREVLVDNDFVRGTKLTELIFSPTPSVGAIGNDRVIPRIIKISDTGVVSSHEGNPRILYYGGMKETNQLWTITSSGQNYSFGSYPYIGHLDDPYTSTVDLCFYPPAEIYWSNYYHSIWYTNNNLFNAYHKQFIDEVTDKNSKIVTAWFKISPLDIKLMDFRKLYYFENEYFRLNKIIDYNPISNSLTKCEFIKINKGVTFAPSSGQLTDGGEANGDEVLPSVFKPAVFNYNTANGQDVIINGTGNSANETVRNALIQGQNIHVGDYSENVAIINSSGVTNIGNQRNVTVFNTKNKRVRNSDTFIVGGQALFGEGTDVLIEFTGSTYSRDADDTSFMHKINASSGNVTISLEDPAGWKGLTRTFKKIDSSVNTVVISAPLYGIDNSPTYTLTAYGQSVTLYSDGSTTFIISSI